MQDIINKLKVIEGIQKKLSKVDTRYNSYGANFEIDSSGYGEVVWYTSNRCEEDRTTLFTFDDEEHFHIKADKWIADYGRITQETDT